MAHVTHDTDDGAFGVVCAENLADGVLAGPQKAC
jgi:hypothetical protein